MTTPQPNLLWLKKAQAIWRGVLTAEVLKFPKEKHNVAFTLLKAATRLEKSSPEGCIALQRRAIALMALELKQARYAAYAAEKALEEVYKELAQPPWDVRLRALMYIHKLMQEAYQHYASRGFSDPTTAEAADSVQEAGKAWTAIRKIAYGDND